LFVIREQTIVTHQIRTSPCVMSLLATSDCPVSIERQAHEVKLTIVLVAETFSFSLYLYRSVEVRKTVAH